MKLANLLISLATGAAVLVSASGVLYDELLELTPLPQHYLLASFQFNSSTPPKSQNHDNHFDMLPRSLLQITRRSHATQLHLRFSRGRWNQQGWGSLPSRGLYAGATGIEVWATIDSENAETDWTNLVNSLSGLFCASMNFIDSTRTVHPRFLFQSTNMGDTFYGVLPSETVCTENLTPFLKLLPCKGHAGIASLLTGHKLFDTDYSTLSVDVSTGPEGVFVKQRVDMVFDLERALFAARDPLPASQPSEDLVCAEGKFYTTDYTCLPVDGRSMQDWSFAQVFAKTLHGRCAASGQDKPALVVNHGSEARLVPHSSLRTENQSRYILDDDMLHLQVSDRTAPVIDVAPIEVRRTLTSHGSSLHGKVTLSVTNREARDAEIVYFSVLPWFMRVYLHSLQTSHTDMINDIWFQPARDRIRPSHLEIKVKVPALETVQISFDFDRTILRYAEYPPDANRGFDVPAAIIVLNSGQYTVRTTDLLLSLPTPDFSMPYNVIILTCTVIALCFGSMFNLVSRRIILASEVPRAIPLKQRLLTFIRRDPQEALSEVQAGSATPLDRKKA